MAETTASNWDKTQSKYTRIAYDVVKTAFTFSKVFIYKKNPISLYLLSTKTSSINIIRFLSRKLGAEIQFKISEIH